MEIVEKNNERIFTKNMGKDIIKKNHTPLKVNYKNLFEKDGLPMKKQKILCIKNEEENMKMKGNNISERLIKTLQKICNEFNINDKERVIKNFLERT